MLIVIAVLLHPSQYRRLGELFVLFYQILLTLEVPSRRVHLPFHLMYARTFLQNFRSYIVVPSLQALSETTAVFRGRGVLAKHKSYSMYRPSAVIVAQSLGDFPIFFLQFLIFTLIIYFMSGLKTTAGHYFTFLLFVFTVTVCTTAFFRFIGQSFGTFNNASKVSGFMFGVIVLVSHHSSSRTDHIVRWVYHLHPANAPLVLLASVAKSCLLWSRGAPIKRAFWPRPPMYSTSTRTIWTRLHRCIPRMCNSRCSTWISHSLRDDLFQHGIGILPVSCLAKLRDHPRSGYLSPRSVYLPDRETTRGWIESCGPALQTGWRR